MRYTATGAQCVCVRSSGKEWSHKKDEGKEKTMPEYSVDYAIPGDEFGFHWCVLVGKERKGLINRFLRQHARRKEARVGLR